MPELSPEVLDFLKFFLSQGQRFDSGQQTTDIQPGGAVGAGGSQVDTSQTDAFQTFLKNFNFGQPTGTQLKKLSFFS